MMFPMSDSQFGLVYNILSFSLASMMATTIFLWMRIPAVKDCYASALIISGEVTFIAAYHYLRIFNSWVDSYYYRPGGQLYPQEGVILEKGKDGLECFVGTVRRARMQFKYRKSRARVRRMVVLQILNFY